MLISSEKTKTSINLIFKNKSENTSENRKWSTLSELKKEKSVISLGSGAFLSKEIRRNTKKLSVSFWLDVPVDELIKRLKKSRKRPLLFQKNIGEAVKKIYYERKKIYNEADYRIKCNSLSLNKIVNKILDLYEKSGN